MDSTVTESSANRPIPPMESKNTKSTGLFSWRAPWNLGHDSGAQGSDWSPSKDIHAGMGGHKTSYASPPYIQNFKEEIWSNLQDTLKDKFRDKTKLRKYIERTIRKFEEKYTERQYARQGHEETPPPFQGRVTYITKAPEDASGDVFTEYPSYKFDLGDPDSMAVKKSLDQIQNQWTFDNKHEVDDRRQSSTIRWIHLQANNMQWIKSVMSPVVATCWPVRGVPLLEQDDWDSMADQILHDDFWRDQIEMNSFNPMGSRSMTPFASHLEIYPERDDTQFPTSNVDVVVAFMPYLHWESSIAATYMRNVIKDIEEGGHDQPKSKKRGRNTSSLTRYMCQDEVLLRTCLSNKPSLHPRRTLDQYHYPYFKDTSGRDADQVVERHVIKHHFDDSAYSLELPLLMVDQCWVWVIGEDTVLTAFPGKWGCQDGDSDPLDLHATMLKNIKKKKHQHYLRSSSQFARFVLRVSAINLLQPSKQPREHHKFLSFFDHAMSDLRERKISRFDSLWRPLETENLQDQLKELFKVKEEYKMLKEALDVAEESSMLEDLLREQDQALEKFEEAQRKILRKAPGMHDSESIMKRSNDETVLFRRPAHKSRRENVERLCQRAKELVDDIRQQLATKQQQASIAEAELTRTLAEDGDSQNKAITLFTIVTIIFLPLSTMASIFGINSSNLGSGSMNLGIIFAIIIPISFICVAISLSVALSSRGRQLASKWFRPRHGSASEPDDHRSRFRKDQDSDAEGDGGVLSGSSSFPLRRLAANAPRRATTEFSNASMPPKTGYQRSPRRHRREKARSTVLMRRPSSSDSSPRQARPALHRDDRSGLSERQDSTGVRTADEEQEGDDLASYSLSSSDNSGDENSGSAANKRLRARRRGRRQT